MGIPFYFKKLVSNFGTKFIKNVQYMDQCDSLYLDFNSMIHQCANEAINKYPTLKYREYYPHIVTLLIDAIICIANVVRPRKLLYIAIDGLCPRAKMQQQRKRRYMTVWRKMMDTTTKQVDWDSNVITPGTDFMQFLDNELETFVEKNKGKLDFEIKLSKSSERGEGEHKIFDVMQTGEDAVIYGLDADLIMLSLISPNNKNIRLLREQDQFGCKKNTKNEYSLLSIKYLYEEISKEFGIDVEDYVMLCVFLGNDFVPPLSYMSIRNHGIEHIIEVFKGLGQQKLVTKKVLNVDVIQKMLQKLAQTEDERMNQACQAYYTTVPRSKSHSSIDCYPQYQKCPYKINPQLDPYWRDTYYKSLVHGSVSDACKLYLEGIQWVFSYYFQRNASFSWYYPFSYSPTIRDLMLTTFPKPVGSETSHISPQLQLLLVLPPQSSHLIESDGLMTNVSKGCCHLYPTMFEVSTFLKTYLWECSPVLPNIDVAMLEKQ